MGDSNFAKSLAKKRAREFGTAFTLDDEDEDEIEMAAGRQPMMRQMDTRSALEPTAPDEGGARPWLAVVAMVRWFCSSQEGDATTARRGGAAPPPTRLVARGRTSW